MLVSTLKTTCTTFGMKNAKKIALKRRNISNSREITLSFRQNRVNGYDLLAAGFVSTLKTSCSTFGVENEMKIVFECRNISKRRERTLSFCQNRVNGCIVRAVGRVSTMKQACITLVA